MVVSCSGGSVFVSLFTDENCTMPDSTPITVGSGVCFSNFSAYQEIVCPPTTPTPSTEVVNGSSSTTPTPTPTPSSNGAPCQASDCNSCVSQFACGWCFQGCSLGTQLCSLPLYSCAVFNPLPPFYPPPTYNPWQYSQPTPTPAPDDTLPVGSIIGICIACIGFLVVCVVIIRLLGKKRQYTGNGTVDSIVVVGHHHGGGWSGNGGNLGGGHGGHGGHGGGGHVCGGHGCGGGGGHH